MYTKSLDSAGRVLHDSKHLLHPRFRHECVAPECHTECNSEQLVVSGGGRVVEPMMSVG